MTPLSKNSGVFFGENQKLKKILNSCKFVWRFAQNMYNKINEKIGEFCKK